MSRKIKAEETERLMELWRCQELIPEIAKQLHIRRGTVYARLRRLREAGMIIDRQNRKYSPSPRRIAALEHLPDLWASDLTTQEIAQRIHYSVPQTFTLVRLLKLPSRHRHHQKPLDEHRQAAIVVLRECGWVFENIAAILTISRQRVHQLWKMAQKKA